MTHVSRSTSLWVAAIVGALSLSTFCYAEAEKAGAKAAGKAVADKEAAAPAEGKNAAKGAGKDVKAGVGKDKEAGKKAIKAPGRIQPEQLEGIKKLFPKLVELREKVDEAQAQIDAVSDISDPRAKTKAERQLPQQQRKLETLKEKLQKEYEKEAKPYEQDWAKLKAQDEKLSEEIAALEAKKKDALKPWSKRDAITKQLTRIDQIRSGLAMIATPELEAEKK